MKGFFSKFFPISTTKLRTFQKTRSSNEACLAAGGWHFGRCLHYVVSITHDLVTLEIKSSIACILRISRLLIPLVRPDVGREWWKVWEQTLGQKERCRRRRDEDMAKKRDMVRMAYYRAKTMLTVQRSARTPLISPTARKSFQVVPSFQPHSLHKSPPFSLPFRTIQDKEDISNMATRLKVQ